IAAAIAVAAARCPPPVSDIAKRMLGVPLTTGSFVITIFFCLVAHHTDCGGWGSLEGPAPPNLPVRFTVVVPQGLVAALSYHETVAATLVHPVPRATLRPPGRPDTSYR